MLPALGFLASISSLLLCDWLSVPFLITLQQQGPCLGTVDDSWSILWKQLPDWLHLRGALSHLETLI